MKNAKRILALTLVIVLALALSSCGKANVLKMGTNAQFPPYEFYEGDKVVGIDAEIAAAIAEKLGMTLEISDMEFDSIIPNLSSGKIDIGAAGMSVTPERLESVDFSDNYAHATQVVIVKTDSAVATPADLVGKKVGVQLGTTGDIYAADIENVDLRQFNKGIDAVTALSQGKIDAVIIDNEPAKVFVSQDATLKILDESFTDEDYAIAIKKGNTELTEKINKALAELKEDGTLDKIVAKYIKA